MTLSSLVLLSVVAPASAQVRPQSGGQPPSVRQQNGGLDQAFARAVRSFEPAAKTGFQAEAPSQRYIAEFSNSGSLTLASGKDRFGVKALAYGVGATRGSLGNTASSVGKDEAGWPKLTFSRSGLTEWYVNGAEGLHHWMQISERPSQSANNLWVRLGLTGNAKASLLSDSSVEVKAGARTFSYSGLRAWDAQGKSLDARLQVSGQEIAVVVNDNAATYPVTIDPVWSQKQTLTFTPGFTDTAAANGKAIAIDGDYAVVGASNGLTANAGVRSGVAYVFFKSGGTWAQQARLVPSQSPAASDLFGSAVAISGDTIVVGTPANTNNNKGRIYVYTRSGTTWTEQTNIPSVDAANNDAFGKSVAVSVDTMAIGASGAGANSKGKVYIYTRASGTWTLQQTIFPGVVNEQVGSSVALGGTNLLIAAVGAGKVYYYTGSGSSWTQRTGASAPSVGFGTSIALSGTTAVVGCPTFSSSRGKAEVYVLNGTTMGSSLTTLAGATGSNQFFGEAVAADGLNIVVGARGTVVGGLVKGAAYTFRYSSLTTFWDPDTSNPLQGSDTAINDAFGTAVAINGNTVMVSKGTTAGGVYVFEGPGIAISFSPTSVIGGTSSTGTVTLSTAAGAGGKVVNLSSGNAAVTVPASVTVLNGATTATFTATTSAVAADVAVSVTGSTSDASYASGSGTLTVTAPTLTDVQLSPATVTAGSSSTGTVTISGPAPTGGFVVNLASNDAHMTVPASVTVLAGNTTVDFTANTTSVVAQTIATVTASRSGSTDKTANLTINPNKILTFTHPSNFMLSGHTERFKINVNTVQASDVVVTLTSSNPNVVVPPTATVKAGSLFATFYATVANVATNETTDLTGTSTNWVTATKTVTLYAPRTASVKFAKTSVAYGNTVRGTVRLDAVAPTGGFVVTLNSNNAALTVPATVTVAAGKYSVGFVATANAVAASTPVTVTATPHRANPVTGSVTVEPYSKVSTVGINHPVLLLGATATGTVHLTSNAPTGGQTVNLTYSAGITGVASVVVPAGTKTANFSITCTSGKRQQGTITASNGLDSAKGTIEFVVPSLASVVLDSTSVTGGASTGVTVTLSKAAPWPGVTVNVSSSDAAASPASGTVFIAEGATSGHVGITTSPVAVKVKAKINANVSISTAVKYAILTITP